MTTSPILNINLLSPTQTNKSTTVNDAIAALEQAMNAKYTNSNADGIDITIATADYTRYASFVFSGATADKNIKFPSQAVTGVNTNRTFLVTNNSTKNLTIKATTGTGASFVLKPNRAAFCQQSFEDIICLALFDTTAFAGAFDLLMWMPGTPLVAALVLKFVAGRSMTIPINFAGSVGKVGTNPAATATFTVKKNGSTVGTIAISNSGVFTFTMASALNLVAGDVVDIFAPSPADGSLADIAVTILGTKV